MADLVKLEEQLFTHYFQCANLSGVPLLGEIHFSVAALSNLRQDLEISVP